MVHSQIQVVTDRIVERSKTTRASYLEQMTAQFQTVAVRSGLHCGNLAHAFAGCGSHDKSVLAGDAQPNLGIVTAYNDMLSAHKPYENYPQAIRVYANKYNAVAQHRHRHGLQRPVVSPCATATLPRFDQNRGAPAGGHSAGGWRRTRHV